MSLTIIEARFAQHLGEAHSIANELEQGQADMPLSERLDSLIAAPHGGAFSLCLLCLDNDSREAVLRWMYGPDVAMFSVDLADKIGLMEIQLRDKGFTLKRADGDLKLFDSWQALIEEVKGNNDSSPLDDVVLATEPKGSSSSHSINVIVPESVQAIREQPAVMTRILKNTNMVTEKVAKASGKSEHELVCKQPHQAVAFGAAILAEQLFGNKTDNTLQSISSYDLGIRTRKSDGTPGVSVLIEKNSPVPATVNTTFYTNRDDQTRLIIEAVQQRETNDGVEESSLGFFAFGPIENPRKLYPIDIEMHYDMEGIETITAKVAETGKTIRQVMDEETEAIDKSLLQQKAWIDKLRINS